MAKKLRQKRRTKTDNLTKKQQELERLGLEIKEREWNVSLVGKLVKLAPLLTPCMLAISILASVYWYTKQWNLQIEQQRLETERQRQETITNFKRELASENPAIRIGAALALTNYPKEAIPVLIHSLSAIKTTNRELEEDKEFTQAVKASLTQIGTEVVTPLVSRLIGVQKELRDVSPKQLAYTLWLTWLYPTHERPLEQSPYNPSLAFSFDTIFYKPLDNIRRKMESQLEFQNHFGLSKLLNKLPELDSKIYFESESQPPRTKEEVDAVISELSRIRSTKYDLILANKNIVEVLTNILRNHRVNDLQLSEIDLSGADLSDTYLSGANMFRTNLCNTQLSGANLSNANLTEANLTNAVLCELPWIKIFFLVSPETKDSAEDRHEARQAILSGANFRRAKFVGVRWFKNIEELSGANLKGVIGLSKEDLEYAKSKGAIID